MCRSVLSRKCYMKMLHVYIIIIYNRCITSIPRPNAGQWESGFSRDSRRTRLCRTSRLTPTIVWHQQGALVWWSIDNRHSYSFWNVGTPVELIALTMNPTFLVDSTPLIVSEQRFLPSSKHRLSLSLWFNDKQVALPQSVMISLVTLQTLLYAKSWAVISLEQS